MGHQEPLSHSPREMDGTGPQSRPFSPMKTHSRRPASVDSRGPRGDRTVAACGARCPWGREPRPAVPVPSGARCPTSHAQPAPFLAGCFFSKEAAVSRGSFAVWPLTALQLTLRPGTRVMPASGARGAATSLHPSGSRGTSQRRPHVQMTSKFPVDRDAPGMRVPEGGRWGDLAGTRLAADGLAQRAHARAAAMPPGTPSVCRARQPCLCSEVGGRCVSRTVARTRDGEPSAVTAPAAGASGPPPTEQGAHPARGARAAPAGRHPQSQALGVVRVRTRPRTRPRGRGRLV